MKSPRRVPAGRSDAKRKGLRPAMRPHRGERWDAPRFLKPDISIELLGEHGVEIVAVNFRVRPINHADRPLEPRLCQKLRYFALPRIPQVRQRPRDTRLPED